MGNRPSSCLESSLTALLHMCHRLCHVQCKAWLLPHVPALWNTLFATYQAFCQTCDQLSMASCAASAQEEQQQQQQQMQMQIQKQDSQCQDNDNGSSPNRVQSVAVRVAMFNALGSSKAGRSSSAVQQSAQQEGAQDSAGQAGPGSGQTRGRCKLLVLLSRCGEMEQLLACLVPGFLALTPHEAQQVISALLLVSQPE